MKPLGFSTNLVTTYASGCLTFEAMDPFRHFFTLVCTVAIFVVNGGRQLTAKAEDAADQQRSAELQVLQGKWEGVDVGDPAQQKITITITENALHFYRDSDFWFEATITLPEGTDPKQFHATIKDCPSSQSDSIGEVVGAIFKIEDGRLTVAPYTMPGDPPETFESVPNRYVITKVEPQESNAGLDSVD